MPEYDIAIIGGGCVGCSIARHLAKRTDLDICVLEKEYHLAQHQSGRNSGVLHPGFNYPPGSLKARYATEGTTRLKQYAQVNDIPLEEFGVVVVAKNPTEERRLDDLQAQADENNVETEIFDSTELTEREPHADGVAALYCPEAASIDSQQYVYTLANEAKHLGVEFFMGHRVTDICHRERGHTIQTSNGCLESRYLVNAAGLYADRIAHQYNVGSKYQVIPFRGEYYELVPERSNLCRTMIYPAPDPELPFLGVHYTRRTDGKVIVGPNAVLALGREAYENTQFNLKEFAETIRYGGFWRLMGNPRMMKVAWDEASKSYLKTKFVEAAQNLVPKVSERDFRRSYAGIRAQLVTEDGTLVKDPMFEHGPNSIHVLNAVSPGLTSSLPFGETIAERVLEDVDR